jgi:LacI family transcriptional regulator
VKKKVTMEHIANIAGVSTNTVSRALSGKPDISTYTREKIKKIALDIGYSFQSKPEDNNKQQQKTHIVGMVIADNTNPVFSKVVKGAEDVLSQSGYQLILCNTDENYRKEKNAIQLLIERDVDGILITPTQLHQKDILIMEKNSIPFVLMGRHFPDEKMSSVVADDRQGAFNAANHLLRLGHRRILFINAPE